MIKNKLILSLLALSFILFNACQKENEMPEIQQPEQAEQEIPFNDGQMELEKN